MAELHLKVNGETRTVTARNADTLLFVLRERLGLTGAKPGCLNGDCGACTVDVDGDAMKSCLMLAVEARHSQITTAEGLAYTGLQAQFIKCFAFQCGYCTPGFIMNANALVNRQPYADDAAITDWLESNICRCTGYAEIGEAVKAALAEAQTQTQTPRP